MLSQQQQPEQGEKHAKERKRKTPTWNGNFTSVQCVCVLKICRRSQIYTLGTPKKSNAHIRDFPSMYGDDSQWACRVV